MEAASSAPATEQIPEPRSRTLDAGIAVHYLEWDGPGETTFVLVHGLGGSAINWLSAAPLLTPRGRVVAPDLAGHGRTARAGRASSVDANRELLDAFLDEIAEE